MTTSQTKPRAAFQFARNFNIQDVGTRPSQIDLSNLKNLGKTRVQGAQPTGIVTKGTGFIKEYDGAINPYMGCSFGCSYCYASNFTANDKDKDEWGQWVKVKTNALMQFARIKPGELNDKIYYVSTVTDPYQPVEKKIELTRGLLEMMVERHPRIKLLMQTRSPMILRDLDLFLRVIEQGGRVQVNMTVTTDDDDIRKAYEPGCPSIQSRLKAIQAVQEAGIQSCITLTPLLPVSDINQFVRTIKETGAKRYIVQPFEMINQDKGRFIGKTDLRAIKCNQEYFGCNEETAMAMYDREFQNNLAVLNREIPGIGYAKAGFEPPF